MIDQNSKNLMSTMLDAQKNMVDTLVENTKKITKGNSFMNDAMEKSTETYNEWMGKQKEAVDTMTKKAETAGETVKEKTSKVKEEAKNWLESQMNWAKQAWEMNQDFLKNAATPKNTNQFSNPMDWMTNMNTKMNETMTQAQNAQQWWNMMQKFNPSNTTDMWKKTADSWTSMFNQYSETMNNSFTELQKTMQGGTSADAYKNMIDVTSGFAKFNEMWAPFLKTIQEKTFNSEEFKKAFDFSANKELMDQFFNFLPEGSNDYMEKSKEMWTKSMKDFYEMSKGQMQGNKEMFAGMNPFANQNMFQNMMNGYTEMQNSFKNAVSPIARMITPNQYTKAAQEWSEIADRMAIYSIKNSELQYMMYQKGNDVMEQLAENISSKIENGIEINNMTELYQEFLKISDKVYVDLFESDEYSKLMAETSAMQLKLKKEMELQTEKMLSNVPVATRSEMDEMYKVIYDLKKQVHQLQKMLELEPIVTPLETEKPKEAKTTTSKPTSKK